LPHVRSLFYLLLFCISFISVAQSRENGYLCDGKLVECLDTIEQIRDVKFNYKSSLVNRKQIILTDRTQSLVSILYQLKKQCFVDSKIYGDNIINLYPLVKKYISGTLLDATSSERIVGATVSIVNQSITVTDPDGMFRLYTIEDSIVVNIYHPDYQLARLKLSAIKNETYRIRLEAVAQLAEVGITSPDSSQLGIKSFDKIDPNKNILPSVGGETDALAGVKLLPGVQPVSFGQQGLSIRGGSPDQNFTLVDGIPVYNTFHLLGLFSIFNSESISSINLHKDEQPAKYTNRLSSVIQVNLKNGNKQKVEAAADVGILSSGIYINGPIIKEKLSFSLSARRTYADILSLPLQRFANRNSSQKNVTKLWSYDVFSKIHYQINKGNELSLTAYNGGDQLDFQSKFSLDDNLNTQEESNGSLGWRNAVIGLRWKSIIGSRVYLNTEVSTSNYELKFNDDYALSQKENQISNSSSYRNGLQEVRMSADLDILWRRSNMLKLGIGVVNYLFRPFERNYSTTNEISVIDTSLVSRQYQSQEYYAFIEGKSYFKGGSVTYGLRAAQFTTVGKTYHRLLPKISLIQGLGKNSQLRMGVTVANQFVHLVPNNNLGLPVDIWLPVTNTLSPMSVTQLNSKFIRKKNNLRLELGVYSKFYSNIIEHKTGSQLLTGNNWENNLRVGSGRAYGLECVLEYKLKNLYLYTSYTFSRSRRTIEGINDGYVYFSKYDRPHMLSATAQYQLANQDKLIASFTYASGNPITIPTSRYITLINGEEVVVEEFSGINNYRMPATHHLDVSYVRNRRHKWFSTSTILGVYNLYNRLNPFMAFVGLDEEAIPELKLRSFLPIMPMAKIIFKL
jgi:hypothetical protein